jgi:hypothetical protein
MSKVYFKYKSHPGDLLRNSEINELPDPDNNLEDFLIWFLDHYQSDSRISYIDDLSKLVDDEFMDANDQVKFEKKVGNKSKSEMMEDIKLLENELKAEAYKNFYRLLLSNKIEILADYEKQ